MPDALKVAISVDVEEEGLFSGRYKCRDVSVTNVASLERLDPLIARGVKPTLFCAYPVFKDEDASAALDKLTPHAEIGAHLHHWNTPPIACNIPVSGELRSAPACQLSAQCLDAKLEHLMRAGQEFLGRPLKSFRMGRWDLHAIAFPILARHGIICDASVRPLHAFSRKDKGPDHFSAPANPYWIDTPEGRLLEAPLTVTPLLSPFAHIPAKFAWGRKLRASLRKWGALALLPVEHPLWLMKLTTNMHAGAGGQFLSLTWHSSEMMPGATPHFSSQAAVDKFLAKISRYLDWLEASFNVSYTTMSELAAMNCWQAAPARKRCDWTWVAKSDA